MNDISNILLKLGQIQLDESTGGLARRWIEVKAGKDIPFVHATTKEVYKLVGLSIIPADPAFKFDDAPKMSGAHKLDLAIQRICEKVVPPVSQTSVFGVKNGKAAIVVIMQKEDGETFAFAKKVYAKKNLGDNAIFWQTTDFARDTGLYAQTAQMKKAILPIEPTDFVAIGTKYNINQLVSAVASGIQKSNVPAELKTGLPILLDNVLKGKDVPVPGLAEFQPAIEIKLSELAAPLALKTGNFVSGNYDNVNEHLLGPMGENWQSSSGVSFPPKAEKLIDATMWFGENKIDISVKDSSGGGRPSTATVAEVLNKGGFNASFKSRFKKEIDAITTLDSMSGIDGPLELAVRLGSLNTSDVTFLKSIYRKGIKNAKLTPNWKKLMGSVSYEPDKTHPEYQLGYHLLAIAAKHVANKLNEDSDKVTTFFKAVLNKSNLVQVYSKTKKDKMGGLNYSQFHVVWPPVFEGTIEVDADSYTARTAPSRKVSFSFNNSKVKKTSGTELANPKKDKGPAPDIRPTAAKVARKKLGFEKTAQNLGRSRR